MSVQRLQCLELAQYKLSDLADFLESGNALSERLLVNIQALQQMLEIELLTVEAKMEKSS